MQHHTQSTRRLLWAGRIIPRSRVRVAGHRGPFVDRPDLSAWIQRLLPGSAPQVDCMACRSSVSAPEVAR